jgi:hypothetical protein
MDCLYYPESPSESLPLTYSISFSGHHEDSAVKEVCNDLPVDGPLSVLSIALMEGKGDIDVSAP